MTTQLCGAMKQIQAELDKIPAEQREMMEKMMPAFHPPYEWALDKSGEHLLGMTQRFGPFNFVVNTDKISRDMAEDQGLKLFVDPAMQDRYGILTFVTGFVVYFLGRAKDFGKRTRLSDKE